MPEFTTTARKSAAGVFFRFVAFESDATNLVPGDTNHDQDIFVYDRQEDTIERVSIAYDGAQANDIGDYP